jgi:DNA-binding GntR family transcriptional regulator
MSPDDKIVNLQVVQNAEVPAGTLASSVYDRLRYDILSGALPPDEKLRTEALRDRYGVGNSPLREALNRLSADGLVTREDQKGFRVATVSRADLEELVKTRCWLEEIALRQSIEN